ncbi:uncharacterized protein LOC119683652 [Teleopsis dalmanni]|uniref:uncharacterized protein LOC119683652 n=1 Tax=Teleopsis dalmanni TaxID=139649 RepID=UPI0018CFD6F1|nr:uncharacterized protein LOC119683652 [Teleopsis dalmanni]
MASSKIWKTVMGAFVKKAVSPANKGKATETQSQEAKSQMSITKLNALRNKNEAAQTTQAEAQRLDDVYFQNINVSKKTAGQTVAEYTEAERLKHESTDSNYSSNKMPNYSKPQSTTKYRGSRRRSISVKYSANMNAPFTPGPRKRCSICEDRAPKKPNVKIETKDEDEN